MVTDKELYRAAEQEASWLHYYGRADDRESDDFSVGFYDRLRSIGYCKRVLELSLRCACMYLTSETPVLESSIDELSSVSGPRWPDKNVCTALEYVLARKLPSYEDHLSKLKS